MAESLFYWFKATVTLGGGVILGLAALFVFAFFTLYIVSIVIGMMSRGFQAILDRTKGHPLPRHDQTEQGDTETLVH